MTNKLLTSVAAGAILLGAAMAPAYAQDTTQPQAGQTESPAVVPDTQTPSTDTQMTTEPLEGAETETQKPMDDTATAPADDPAASMAEADNTYLSEQSENQISANTYIGQPVYNSADESIGTINDLIMEKDGGITAAVIGVGGFLGIGEKWVAVPFENVAVTRIPDSAEVKLTTSETSESLQAAPEFKTLSQQMAERNAVDTTPTASTTTEPAPVTEPAPAPAPAE